MNDMTQKPFAGAAIRHGLTERRGAYNFAFR